MGGQMTMDSTLFLRTRATVSGLFVFTELHKETAAVGLARLAKLVDQGVLKPQISLTASWQEAGPVARQLLDRAYPGKAVLTVD
jgi:NADPH2:quinone reductase